MSINVTATATIINEGDARDRVILASRAIEEAEYLFEEGKITEAELDAAETELGEAKKELASC